MIELGSEVRDKVSGFQGIAVTRCTFMTGCARISVQPPHDKKKNELPKQEVFDEPMLEILTPPAAKAKPPMGSGVG